MSWETTPSVAHRFCPELQQMIATGWAHDRDGNNVHATGVSTVNNLVVLDHLQRSTNACATLEIGLAYAASALVFANNHSLAGRPPHSHVAIDPFQHHLNYAGLTMLESAGLLQHVRHIADFSDRALPSLLSDGAQFGMIYIDGSHLFEDVFLDCHYAAQLLEPDGIMLLDDSSDKHVRKVIRFLRGNMRHMLTEVDLAPYRMDRGRSAKYRVGKALGRTQLTAFRKIGEGRRAYDAPLKNF